MAISSDKIYLVTNRSASRVHYAISELGIKSRDYQPGETKKIKYAELQALYYMPGGMELMRDYLLIRDPEVREEFIGQVEPEYNMTDKEVKELILHGSLDEWLDCLDFAPEGVIDLIKRYSVDLPLTDTRKMDAFKEKKGVDLGRMIRAKQEEEAERAAEEQNSQQNVRQRRVQPQAAPKVTETTGRRTSGSKYKVISKSNE